MSTTAEIYEDRSNSFYVNLTKNKIALNLSEMNSFTKYEIRYQDTYYDSDDYPDAFVADNDNSRIKIKPISLGLAASNKKGELVEFIIYDVEDNVSGLMWDQFTLIVKEDAALIAT
jgi:hypothetical protein